jgi:hypothetical protein
MNILSALRLVVVLGLFSCAVRKPASESAQTPDYPQIFRKSLELYRARVQDTQDPDLKPLKKFAESDFVAMAQRDSEVLTYNREKLLRDINEESKNPDITKHLRLVPPQGKWGYEDLTIKVSHPYDFRGQLVPAGDLLNEWMRFLNEAHHEIVLNVFDFDLMEVAELLIAKSRSGVRVGVGIDRKVVRARPQVEAVYNALLAGGVNVFAVNAVGLNHQKMAAIDWSHPERSKALFSSGNLTQSCLHPRGDLKDADPLPKESIPNANHVITMKSWLLANLVQHELSKAFDSTLPLRGAQYPLNGAYQVSGPGVPPSTFEAYPEPSVIVTFTPGGGYRSVNKNLLARLIEKTTGPVRMIQFAYSAEAVSEALLERAQREYGETGHFDFLSIGDTPFAMQGWSQFLKMSGWKLVREEGVRRYEVDADSPWIAGLAPHQLRDLRSRVRIAPPIYGSKWLKIDDKSHHVTAKIHHKIMTTGPFAVIGTSFNFSQGAETNSEQILVFKDSELVERVNGMASWLHRSSPRSVDAEARRRNRLPVFKISESKEFEDLPADYVVPGPKEDAEVHGRQIF